MMRWGLNSEYGRLTTVLLHQPGADIASHPEPQIIRHLRPIKAVRMENEFTAVVDTFAALEIDTEFIDPTPITADRAYLYNLMFCRDLFFMTPAGAILASMAHETRQGETLYAARTLKNMGVPIIHQISADGRFEGADALWINKELVAIGVGNRTNEAAFAQLRQVLAASNIACVALPNDQRATQHLLGTLQIVDHDLALLRRSITDPQVATFLQQQGFTVVDVPENSEVTEKQAMNIVTVAPRRIIMAASCPLTRQLYLNAGLTIAAELDISQLINDVGGIACATGIVGREDSFDDSRSEML